MSQNATLSLFRQWYGSKRFFNVLMVKKNAPLPVNERLVYSYLVYRSARGGCHLTDVSRATGLTRLTASKVRDKLVSLGLVEISGRKTIALEPPTPDWFVWRKDRQGETWNRRLVGFPVAHCPDHFTAAQNVLYFSLLQPNQQFGLKLNPQQKKTGLAAMLGISHDTVHRSFRIFEGLGLLDYGYLRRPTAELLGNYPDRPKPEEREWVASIACGWPFQSLENGPTMARWVDQASKKMLKAGYSRDEVLSHWEKISGVTRKEKILYAFLTAWDELFLRAQEQTARNKSDGKYKGKNSCGLLNDLAVNSLKRRIMESEIIEQFPGK